ncbi:MAG: TrkH family potassium uptake protein [Kiritimatiellae bacterium]|nr:TrkH family potassium uptake protein [Kiritimatiellia bacterium]MDW8459128.1 TrkH family potassium uptake protein [Verrucomicrobiota bacterium]
MNFRAVFHLISFLPLVMGAAMLVCLGVGAALGDSPNAQLAFALAAGFSLASGAALWAFTRGPVDLNRRDGVGVVAFGWLTSTLLGAIPFVLSGATPSLADAWFESVSGFTTTGASVMSDLESAPRSILLWRAVTQFLGGMGILVLCVAILPLLGSGGMQIYKAEAAGPAKDRLTPRIAVTAKLLWGVYIGLTVVTIALLRWAGMGWFDAVCHAFATTATGGFSTRSASVSAFGNPAIEWIILVVMFLSGINFALHWRLLRGEWSAWARDREWRLYILILAAAAAVILANAGFRNYGGEMSPGLREILFTVVSIMTTTGFTTHDYTLWPALSQYLLFGLMLIGGCAGSTAGGIKVVRVLVLAKQVSREIKLFIQPQAIFNIKIGRQIIDPEIVSMISAFFLIYTLIWATASAMLAAFTPDLKTAVSAAVSCLGNVGPGLGSVGPAGNYAFFPDAAKALLSVCMLLGRLELYTLLVILIPRFWRR